MLRMTPKEVTVGGTGDSGPFGRAELYKQAQNNLTSILQQMPTQGVFLGGLGRWTGGSLCSPSSFQVEVVPPIFNNQSLCAGSSHLPFRIISVPGMPPRGFISGVSCLGVNVTDTSCNCITSWMMWCSDPQLTVQYVDHLVHLYNDSLP